MSEKSESRNENPNHNQASPPPLLAEKTVLVDADGSLTLKDATSRLILYPRQLGQRRFKRRHIQREASNLGIE